MDQFDTLKREATKLERNLEDKVARYQQVRSVVINIFTCLRLFVCSILSCIGLNSIQLN